MSPLLLSFSKPTETTTQKHVENTLSDDEEWLSDDEAVVSPYNNVVGTGATKRSKLVLVFHTYGKLTAHQPNFQGERAGRMAFMVL